MVSSVKVSDRDYLERSKTKLLTFPDRVARLITLKQRQWDALDWIAAHDGTGTIDETLWVAYQLALEFHDPSIISFEQKLRRSLPNAISGCMSSVIQHENPLMQDDSALPLED